MPPTLHPYLKRGLDFDSSPIDAVDLVEDIPAERHDPEYNAAKRRRVEAIALQYLKGKPPLILTARLKGPFTRDWRNPWAEDENSKAVAQGKSTVERHVRREKRASKATQVASPEASRAAGHTEDLCSQSDLEPLPATAPIPDEHDTSSAAEFFSLDTEQFVANNSPTNPFWLRRPTASIIFPPNCQTDKSPTKPRTRQGRFNPRKSLQLVPPREPLGGQLLPIRGTPPDERRSSASAAMDISSIPKTVTTAKQVTEQEPSLTASPTDTLADIPDSSRLRADSAQEEEARSSQAAQHVQATLAAGTRHNLPNDGTVVSPERATVKSGHTRSFDSLVPATTYKEFSTVQVPQSSPIVSWADIQKSATKLAGSKPNSASRQQPTPVVQRVTHLPRNPRHNLVASPAPDSSTGFAYRKVGQPRNEFDNVAKAKPRAVSFSSSPTLKKKEGPSGSALRPEKETSIVGDRTTGSTEVRMSAEAVDEEAGKDSDEETVQEAEEDQGPAEQQDSYKSKQSQYSTQAAMLLAQLEFQEDSSQSSTLSATLRPWSQPAQNTSPPLLPQPSPAITPLSVFNARTDVSFGGMMGDSMLHDPLISTQDLFDAASPFAFSTVKKTSQYPRRSSLRSAVASRMNESVTAKSPTPCAERVPLKEKNTPSLWSATHDKSLLSASKFTSQSPKRTSTDVELPKLDFNASLDFGPTTDFTDCFLKGLHNEP